MLIRRSLFCFWTWQLLCVLHTCTLTCSDPDPDGYGCSQPSLPIRDPRSPEPPRAAWWKLFAERDGSKAQPKSLSRGKTEAAWGGKATFASKLQTSFASLPLQNCRMSVPWQRLPSPAAWKACEPGGCWVLLPCPRCGMGRQNGLQGQALTRASGAAPSRSDPRAAAPSVTGAGIHPALNSSSPRGGGTAAAGCLGCTHFSAIIFTFNTLSRSELFYFSTASCALPSPV